MNILIRSFLEMFSASKTKGLENLTPEFDEIGVLDQG